MSLEYAVYLNETAQEAENTDTLELRIGKRDLLTILTGMELTQSIFPDSMKNLTSLWNKISKEIDSQKECEWK